MYKFAKALVIIPLIIILMSSSNQNNSIYNYSFKDINGKEVSFSEFKGKSILIVNTASECGYTPQYQQLQELYELYKDKIVVIGFPSNQFGGQEPGSEAEILKFCREKYGVSFPLSQKVDVKGENIHPVYQWLTTKELNGTGDHEIKWNFHKFVIDKNGNFKASISTRVEPLDEEVLEALGIKD